MYLVLAIYTLDQEHINSVSVQVLIPYTVAAIHDILARRYPTD